MHWAFYIYPLLIGVTWQFNDAIGTGIAADGKIPDLDTGTENDVITLIQASKQETPGVAVDDKFDVLDTGRDENILNATSNSETFPRQRSRSGYNPVRNLRASSNQVGQLTVKWKPPDIDETLYVNVGYVVKYSLRRHIACTTNVENFEQSSLDVNTTEGILHDLEEYATYNISVTPRTRHLVLSIERFGISVSTVGQTLSNAPAANLQPVTSSEPSTSTNIMFSWNRVTCENQNGPDFSYSCTLYKIIDGKLPETVRAVLVTDESYVFTDLEPCTSYRFGVTPKNRVDTAYPEYVDVQTPPAPFDVVRDFSFRPDVESGNIMVQWQPPRHTTCPITAYSLTTTLQKQQACRHKVVASVVKTVKIFKGTSYVLNNTLPYATYTVSVSTNGEDEELTGPAFEEVITTSRRAPASSPAVSFDSLSSTATSLVFTWDPVPCEDINGAFIQYTYTFHRTGSDVLVEKGNIRDQYVNRKRFEGLDPCTNYTFNIRVDNDLFQSDFNTAQGETKLAIPGEDLNFSLMPGTYPTCDTLTACLVATWRTPEANSCPITNQVISLHQLDDDNCTESFKLMTSFKLSESERRKVFGELKHNSLYRATLVVSNSVGEVETAQEERTSEAAPTGSPQHIAVRRPIRRTRVNISWEEPECGLRNGKIIEYSYVLRQREVVVQTGVTSTKWHHFVNLRGATMYSFTVNASTAMGTGPSWESVYNDHLFFMTRS